MGVGINGGNHHVIRKMKRADGTYSAIHYYHRFGGCGRYVGVGGGVDGV